MKKIYQAPEVLTLKLYGQDAMLIGTSGSTVTGDDGGWVKEKGNDWDDIWNNGSTSHVNVDE